MSSGVMVGILKLSIAIVILCRPFYYLHIKMLNLPEETGYTTQEIKTAYNEMLDYCIGVDDNFSTGILAYSEEGKDHFTDCRKLFILDFDLLIFSIIAISFGFAIKKIAQVEPYRFNNHSFWYYGATCLLIIFIVIALVGCIDFDKTFVIFHMLFFPGKTNWYFDPRYDQIINILPEAYFANCALAIVLIMFAICLFIIFKEKKSLKKQSND